MTRSNPEGEVPYNPFVAPSGMGSSSHETLGSLVLSREEVPFSSDGFVALAEKEEPGSPRGRALVAAAQHVAWVAQAFELPESDVITHRMLPNSTVELVFPPEPEETN